MDFKIYDSIFSEFKKTDLAKSYRSTANKEKYVKVMNKLFEELEKEDILDETADEFYEKYMSKPRIIRQGQKYLDLRSTSKPFKSYLLEWINYKMGERKYGVPTIEEPRDAFDPVNLLFKNAGISKKQLMQCAKHKNKLSDEQTKQIKEFVNQIPADMYDSNKTLRAIRDAFSSDK